MHLFRFAALLLCFSAFFCVSKKPAPEAEASQEKTLDIGSIWSAISNQDEAKDSALNNTDMYAWQLFVALNWPVDDAANGQPDTGKTLNSGSATVWETWKKTTEVYLPDGSPPPPWNAPKETPAEVLAKAEQMGLPPGPFQNLAEFVQVDGFDFKDKQGVTVRYEVLMDKAAFDYIVQEKIYNLNGQEALAKTDRPFDFPNNAMEVKTSWIWLEGNPDRATIEETYYTVNAYYQTLGNDGMPTGYEVGRAAMSGMHIITKALPQWVWITFENVDNAKYTQSTVELPIPEGAKAANSVYQKALTGSVFANYQLIGTQIEFTDNGQPTLLANSQIESAFQQTSSCITCHELATVATTDSGALRFPFIDTSGGNVNYYVGDPPPTPGFKKMDFVWSLRLAHRKR